ncbi:unnamed protein product [Acanthoscelides obtectus]|uniref:Transposase n=1 Tax=Acanthoscelides obtectus TaxID=200917 RepID=A0A9P0Q583_ACAOB|nr:unnamed protein product [Acanthoscelides obtectus]CAK1672450.1 Histone-lysine N-methyltransferase SETMAR [Acanthoscelides obtectus]
MRSFGLFSYRPHWVLPLTREHRRNRLEWCRQRSLWDQEWNSIVFSLLSVFGNEAPHQSTISRWYGEFKRGRVSLSDDPKVEQKASRVNWCQKTLDRFNSGNSKNVYSIVIGDESWIYSNKVIRSRSVPKKMVATFVSKPCHIATIPLNKQRTYLTEENVELLDHPPHSPDLSPNDFFTLPKIKNRLRGQRFHSPEEAVDAFKNSFERMQMCINLRGEYFQKQ